MKHLRRDAVAQAFAETVVEPVDSLIKINGTDLEETDLLGKELAQEPIGVLVGATLPSVMSPRQFHWPATHSEALPISICEKELMPRKNRFTVVRPPTFKGY